MSLEKLSNAYKAIGEKGGFKTKFEPLDDGHYFVILDEVEEKESKAGNAMFLFKWSVKQNIGDPTDSNKSIGKTEYMYVVLENKLDGKKNEDAIKRAGQTLKRLGFDLSSGEVSLTDVPKLMGQHKALATIFDLKISSHQGDKIDPKTNEKVVFRNVSVKPLTV